MRKELIDEMKSIILKHIGVDFEDVMYKSYPESDENDWMEEDYEPEVVFNKDGVIATIEWELGDVFIDGLSEDEINYIKGGEII